MRRLLFVEDHPDTLIAVTLLLRMRGFEVSTATSVEEAHAKLTSEQFEIVVADLTLHKNASDHERSWRDIAQLVEHARPARVGLLSGSPVSTSQALRHGLAFALRKPCDFELLLAEIERSRIQQLPV
ncbi:MAG: hypothetical protein JWP01_429 [Myxococcales bacterium]|nr:hypothetical protein [Myxococcales bacterium]